MTARQIPRGRFRCLLADPPWPARDQGSRMAPAYAGRGRRLAHYPIETISEIKGRGEAIRRIVAVDAFLFLWIPNYLAIEGIGAEVARAWGFVAKQSIPWLKTDSKGKPRLGGGHYTRVCTETLILARRGRAKVKRRDLPGVIIAPRTKHSAKPDESYRMIERLVDGPRIELYARRRFSRRWRVWGNEITDYEPEALAVGKVAA